MVKPRVLGLVVVAALFAAACGGSSPSTSAKGPTRFAVLEILSGTALALGQQDLQGVQMAVDEINAAGGINGSKIELDTQDTALNAATTVALVNKENADSSILAIHGPLSTPELVAAANVCGSDKIVCLAAGSTSPWVGAFNDWTFRSNLISVIALPSVLKTVKSKVPIKSIAIMDDSGNPCSIGETAQLRGTIAQNLGLNVLDVEGYRQTDTDFTPELAKILPQKPDLLYITGISDQAALIIQQARQRGYTGEILGGCSDLNDAQILKKSNNAAVNAITFSSFNIFDTRPIVQKFVANYRAKYNSDPSNFVAAGYDSMYIFADAAKRANTTTNRQAFRDALGKTSGLVGVNGTYTYKNSGDNQTPGFAIFRIKAGGGYVAF